ncbi:PilZ domain-containing protein [Methylomarinum sp. Ch1-1]|uniref:PilZ domain-containing protein n=1 Tax=Methylomarinum roseum TaxID=3067653 RepID=A0AAU7NYI6_9GAMM|nr:PilZ domain-containing protein [Methylomarinum sp. Ch1-1]MDP4521849.1 PilZ domain-containing protein [Methylomarinum sp. Ch1-1]
MLEYDEKRSYIRMDVDCDITYKLADSDEVQTGRCTSISGAGLSFITESPFNEGAAMEVSVLPKKSVTPPMTAFIKVVRCTEMDVNNYEIAATIKSIKGN